MLDAFQRMNKINTLSCAKCIDAPYAPYEMHPRQKWVAFTPRS